MSQSLSDDCWLILPETNVAQRARVVAQQTQQMCPFTTLFIAHAAPEQRLCRCVVPVNGLVGLHFILTAKAQAAIRSALCACVPLASIPLCRRRCVTPNRAQAHVAVVGSNEPMPANTV